MRIISFILIALLVTSCGGISTEEREKQNRQKEDKISKEMEEKDFGPEPKNYKKIFERAVSETLKDPNSGQFRNISPPKKGWIPPTLKQQRTAIILGVPAETTYGWMICGEYNAKNSYGAYVGFNTAVVVFRSGKYLNLDLDDHTILENKTRLTEYCGYLPPYSFRR
jgi:hypothetical protein